LIGNRGSNLKSNVDKNVKSLNLGKPRKKKSGGKRGLKRNLTEKENQVFNKHL
jgi:hypothetical protein